MKVICKMSLFIAHKRGKAEVYLWLGKLAEDMQLKSH